MKETQREKEEEGTFCIHIGAKSCMRGGGERTEREAVGGEKEIDDDKKEVFISHIAVSSVGNKVRG